MRPDPASTINQNLKQALMLLAVDPSLKGVLTNSKDAIVSSRAAKFYQAILPDDSTRIIKVPLNVTEDRLLGSIDIERTIETGRRQIAPGLLAQADQGILAVENINLLDAGIINHIASALDSSLVRLEREGISESQAAEFVLLGSLDTAEGELNLMLRDRVGLVVDSDETESLDERISNTGRELSIDDAGFENCDQSRIELEEIKAAVMQARRQLQRVKVSRRDATLLIEAGLQLGVEGNRADIFALRAARASAALAGRRSVAEEDIVNAIRFVFLPRANEMTQIEEGSLPQPEREVQTPNNQESQFDNEGAKDAERNLEEIIIEAADSRLPTNVLEITQHRPRNSATGKRADSRASSRGRYTSNTMKRPREARVAIDATLRAAAPFQPARSRCDSAIDATSDYRNRRIRIIPDDLRYKRFKRKAGMLFIFCVDASGSMAANRMAQAKGALTRLLQDAYLHRDRVALVSFRGNEADLLLEPTRSVELGKRIIDALPSGGGTPLAKGLLRAMELVRLSRSKQKEDAMLVLFTDGRANVGLHTNNAREINRHRTAIEEELQQIGAALQRSGVYSVVIDTRSKFLSGGEGAALADWLGGRYIYLPRRSADSIYEVVASAATDARTVSR